MTSAPAPPFWTPPTGPVSFSYQNDVGRQRRRTLRTLLVLIPALLVVAGAASFITVLATGGGHTTAGSGSAAASPTSAKHATFGTLTAEHGSTWTVRTPQGTTVSVDVGSSTSFGTKAHPSQADAFHDGAKVKIVGATKGATIEARRVMIMSGTTSSGNGSST